MKKWNLVRLWARVVAKQWRQKMGWRVVGRQDVSSASLDWRTKREARDKREDENQGKVLKDVNLLRYRIDNSVLAVSDSLAATCHSYRAIHELLRIQIDQLHLWKFQF